jgi:phytanoyl-CoA dioxygenase PhyH
MAVGGGERVLSREQHDKYERDGYLVLDSGCAESVVDGAVSDLAPLYGKEGEEEGVAFQGHRVRNAWKISTNVKALALAPKILAALEELYGRKPKPFQTLNFQYGTEQATHSDAIHFNSEPRDYMCGVWIALEDMDDSNGPLVYYPGSQKLPMVTMQDVGVPPEREYYNDYTAYLAELIEREQLEPELATIRKGEAIVWSANILHGGSPRKDMSRTRLSQVTHFYFEDCRYWMPMLSTDDDVKWTHPSFFA